MKILLDQAYSFCQKGQRDYQEDARWPDTDIPMLSQRFFIVCDGVGGCECGEVASSTVCRAMARSMDGLDYSKDFTTAVFSKIFDAAYDALDDIRNEANEDMATTMTMLCFHAGGCTMAHVGDSRIYQFRKSEGIIYRSNDHSLTNKLVHEGLLSPEQAVNHSQGNVITRYMSSVGKDEERWEATVVTTKDIQEGDTFILCTDGVTHCVTDEQLMEILNDDCSDEAKVSHIAEICRNSQDNNTYYLVRVKNVVEECNDNCDGNKSSLTKRLKQNVFHATEVKSIQKKQKRSFFDKIMNFINYKK